MAIFRRKSGAKKAGFLARLGRDQAGNVFAMTAAAVVPMIGVVGGAIDASRMYLVRSRLQAACDSGVLAGRKAMATKTYTAGAVEDQRAKAMFNFNFQNSDFGTSGTQFLPAADSTGKLNATANTSIPMTLMRVFGFSTQSVSVACSADIQIPNIDIVFVLDVTGSMDEKVSGTKKIVAMKAAAKSFYNELATKIGASGAGRVRYGFVPYSQAVNVKDLFTSTWSSTDGQTKGQASLDNISSTTTIQSRVANFEAVSSGTPEYVVDTDEAPISFNQTFSMSQPDSREPFKASSGSATNIESGACNNYATNKDTGYPLSWWPSNTTYFYPNTSYNPNNSASELYATSSNATTVSRTELTTPIYWKITFSRVSGSDSFLSQTACTRKVTWTKYKKETHIEYRFKNYTYKPVALDTSAFKTGATIGYVAGVNSNYVVSTGGEFDMLTMAGWPNGTGLTKKTTKWDGCIEERDTVAVNTFAPIPAGAYDLNYLLAGTSDATRWRPIMDDLTWNRGKTGNTTTTNELNRASSYSCPGASIRNLQEWTKSEFDAYVDSLSPVGYTYLDVGMIWGLRLISPQGMWGYRNLTGANGGQISRHIIFLTDGEPVSQSDTYSAYGVEVMQKRITGNTGTSAATLHARRLQALCDAQRGSVTIWAIAFDTSVSGNLSNCADPNRAYEADDADELEDAFDAIANDIADLRLVQ